MGVKISELTSATSLTGSEELPIVQAGNTKKATISQVKAQNYSTTEQVVGTWIDGKPLYEITLTGQVPSTQTNGTYVSGAIDISSLSAEMMFIKTMFFAENNDGTGEVVNMPYMTNSNYQTKAVILSSRVSISLLNAVTTYNNRYIFAVVCYTKTTDTATQTRSANLTMNTGSLVGSGEKGNLLLEDFSGDVKEEDTTEEVKEEAKEDTTEAIQENKEAEGSGDER